MCTDCQDKKREAERKKILIDAQRKQRQKAVDNRELIKK